MRKATKRRQKGENVTSEDIKARMEKREMNKAKEDLKTQKKEARKAGRKFSTPKDRSQYVAPNGKEYMGPGYGPKRERKAKEEAPKKAPRRSPAAGREDMMSRQRRQEIMDREERKRKNDKDKGGSSVVGG